MTALRRVVVCLALAVASVSLSGQDLTLPVRPGSVRFAAIGDMGTGKPPQYEVAAQMDVFRRVFPFEFVIMLGDNLYGGNRPRDYLNKFELPYKTLLDAGRQARLQALVTARPAATPRRAGPGPVLSRGVANLRTSRRRAGGGEVGRRRRAWARRSTTQPGI